MSVRKLPANGFARLLHRPGQIEVTGRRAGTHRAMRCRKAWTPMCLLARRTPASRRLPPPRAAHRWRSIAWLESLGLLPEFADRLELKLRADHGTQAAGHAHRRMDAGPRHVGDFLAPAAARKTARAGRMCSSDRPDRARPRRCANG